MWKWIKKLITKEKREEAKHIKSIIRYNERELRRKKYIPEQKETKKGKKGFASRSPGGVFVSNSVKNPNYPSASPTGRSRKVFCNRFVSSFTWFSGKSKSPSYRNAFDALKAHLKYISNDKREDLELIYNNDIEKWKELTELELNRRWDARFACKFFLTLPNDLTAEEALTLIKKLIDEEIQANFYTIAIHRNKSLIEQKDNLHAHIVFSSRTKNGKRIKFNRQDLSRIHKRWNQILYEYGYIIKTATWRNRERVKLYRNKELDETAITYIKTQRRLWALYTQAIDAEATERERTKKKEEEKRTIPTPSLRDTLKRILQTREIQPKPKPETQEPLIIAKQNSKIYKPNRNRSP